MGSLLTPSSTDGPRVDGDSNEASSDRLLRLVRRTAASGLAAVLAGVLAGGIGGRIVMRISALMNPVRDGVRTSNGNRIGEITASGTFELVVFGGILTGAAVAWGWVIVRPWLPAGPSRHVIAGGVAATTLGFLVIEGDNFDFSILDPLWLHIAMFLGIMAVAGMLTSWFDDRIRLHDRPSFTFPALVMCGFGALLAIPGILQFFSTSFCFCESPPRMVGVFVLLTMSITVVTWVNDIAARPPPRHLPWIGRAGVAAAAVSGVIYLAQQIIELT